MEEPLPTPDEPQAPAPAADAARLDSLESSISSVAATAQAQTEAIQTLAQTMANQTPAPAPTPVPTPDADRELEDFARNPSQFSANAAQGAVERAMEGQGVVDSTLALALHDRQLADERDAFVREHGEQAWTELIEPTITPQIASERQNNPVRLASPGLLSNLIKYAKGSDTERLFELTKEYRDAGAKVEADNLKRLTEQTVAALPAGVGRVRMRQGANGEEVDIEGFDLMMAETKGKSAVNIPKEVFAKFHAHAGRPLYATDAKEIMAQKEAS